MRIASRNGGDIITRCRSPKLIRSQNALNFAYILYLKLKSQNYNPADIGTYVRKWFVLSILTGRYSGSPESKFDFDIKNISSKNFKEYLESIENAELSVAFWDIALVQNLNTSVSSSPNFNVYFDELKEQCNGAGLKYGGIDNFQSLEDNLMMNCIPDTIFSMNIDNYDDFLTQRRLLMAKKIKDYYYSL